MSILRCTLVILLQCAVLTGCASTAPDARPAGAISAGEFAIDPSLTSAENLQRLASLEVDSGELVALPVPPPPGLPAAAVDERGPDDLQAFMSLRQTIVAVAESVGLPEPTAQKQPPASPADADEALRYYIRGRDLALQGDYHAAIAELRQARELDEANPAIIRALTHSLFAVGSGGEAIKLCEEIVSIDPDDSEAVFTLGLADAARGDFTAAVARLSPRMLASRSYDHDPLADVLAYHVVWRAMNDQGYDLASIEAGRRVLVGIENVTSPTRYRQRAVPIYQTRGLIRLAIGDAFCRLGRYAEARKAYSASTLTPTSPPRGLSSRLVYADLRLGRLFDAQVELLAALNADHATSGRGNLLLCRYLARHVPDRTLLGQAVAELLQARSDDPHLVRAAAAVMHDDAGEETLNQFLEDHPQDIRAAGDLIRRMARRDVAAAVARTAALVATEPDLAARFVQHLMVASVGLSPTLAAARELPPSAAMRIVEIRLLVEAGALGEAWTVCQAARATWPDDRDLLIQQIELSGMLEEASLVDELAPAFSTADGASFWLALSRARRATGQLDLAASAAIVAVEEEPDNPAALIELASVYLAKAAGDEAGTDRRDAALQAQRYAGRAVEIAPDNDQAHQILMSLYGRGGPLENPELYKQTGHKLREVNPDSHLYNRIVAREELGRGQSQQAIQRLLDLYEDDPTDSAAVVLAVAGWLQIDEAETAIAWLDEQLALRPGHPALLEQWVNLALRLKRTDEVTARLSKTWQSDPPDHAAGRLLESVYRMTGRNDEAVAMGRDRLFGQPRTVRRELEFAALHGGAGQPGEAFERLDWILQRADRATVDELITAVDIVERLDPNDLRRDAMTLSLTEQIVQRDPTAPFGLYAARLRAMAVSGWTGDDFESLVAQALRNAKGATGPSPQDVVIWRDLAQKLVDAGEPCIAARTLRSRLSAVAPLETAARSLLMTVAIVVDAVCGEQAEATIRLLRDLSDDGLLPPFPWDQETPTLADALYEASQIYAIVGDESGTELILLGLLALEPDRAMAMNNLGYSRIEAGHSDPQTVKWIEFAHQAMPDDVSVTDTIAWLRYKQGRYEDAAGQAGAATLLMRALKAEDEPSAELRDHIGDVAWRMGRSDAALQAWRQAAAILENPEHRQGNVQNYLFLQTRMWGILVADPREMYHRNYSVLLERTRRKIEAVQAGEEPPVAPIFEGSQDPDRPQEKGDYGDRQMER